MSNENHGAGKNRYSFACTSGSNPKQGYQSLREHFTVSVPDLVVHIPSVNVEVIVRGIDPINDGCRPSCDWSW